MALEGDSSGFGGSSPMREILDASAPGAKKDDFYVVIASCSDDEDKEGEKGMTSSHQGTINEAGDNCLSAKGLPQQENEAGAERLDDDFVIIYADDEGGGEGPGTGGDNDGQAVVPGETNNLSQSSSAASQASNFESLVNIFSNVENPALPGSGSVSADQSLVTVSGVNVRPSPFPAEQMFHSAGLTTRLLGGDKAGNPGTVTSNVLENSESNLNPAKNQPLVEIATPMEPGLLEEDAGSSTFLSQVRFFAGRTWAVRGEKVKESKRQKSIPADLMHTVKHSDTKSARGASRGGRGGSRGSAKRSRSRVKGRGGLITAKVTGAKSGDDDKSQSTDKKSLASKTVVHSKTRGGFARRGFGRGRGGASSAETRSDPTPAAQSDSETEVKPQAPQTSRRGSWPRSRGASRARGRWQRGILGRGVKRPPSKESSQSGSPSRTSRTTAPVLKKGSPALSSSPITRQKSAADKSHYSSPLHTRSSGTSGSSDERPSSSVKLHAGLGTSFSSPVKKFDKKKSVGGVNASSKDSLMLDRKFRGSSVASGSRSPHDKRDISPVVKLVKLPGSETPDYYSSKRLHDVDEEEGKPGPSKRARTSQKFSHSQQVTAGGPRDEKPDSLTKSVGGVMSYLFGENLVGQCPAGFVVNVKLEVEKKKEGETACASTGHQCCQCHITGSNPEDCPCLQRMSDVQMAALLRKQIEKRGGMTARMRAKVLAYVTHVIQELDNT